MRVPKIVKNAVKCVFASLCSLPVCLMNVFWLCLGNKNRLTQIPEQAHALLLIGQSATEMPSIEEDVVDFQNNWK